MNELNSIFTLLRDISDEDYDSLISQELLRLDGYKIHYIIDADLIYNYCYPKGIVEENTRKERKRKLNSDYLADEQVTLHSVFYLNKEQDRVIFFNQYFQELEGMIMQALLTSSDANKDIDLFELSAEGNLTNPNINEILFNSFSKLYSTILFHIDGLTKVNNLFRNKAMIIESSEFNNQFLRKTADVNVGTINDTNYILSVFENIFNYSRDNKYPIFPSKKRDAIIIDRVISFNRFTQQYGKDEEKKHVFLFLTDSSLNTQVIKFICNKDTKLKYPLIHNQKIEFARSIPQTFAYLISLSYDDYGILNTSKTIDNLKELKSVSKEVNSKIDIAKMVLNINKDELLNKEIFNNYVKIRNAFENAGMLKSFDKLYDLIKDSLNEEDLKIIANIFKYAHDNLKSLQREVLAKHLVFLRNLKYEASFNSSFIYGIDRIRQSGDVFDLSKGSDYIEGSYQHLPILITFPSNQNMHLHLNNLISLVLERKIDQSNIICNELESILDLMKSSKHSEVEMIEINLLKTLIFMILPSSQNIEHKKGTIKENDYIAYKWLKELIKNRIDNIDLEADILYLMTWACRRIKEYDESMKYALDGITKYISDPRFYHGRFLTNYCIYEESTVKSEALLNSAISDLEKSHTLYLYFIKNNFSNYSSLLLMLQKMEDSFNNSLCYCLALKVDFYITNKMELKHNENIILRARSLLDKLKHNNIFRDYLPEYLDTDAMLNLMESYVFKESKIKLEKAKISILEAIRLSTNTSLIDKYQNKLRRIETRMVELEDSP